MLYSNKAEWLLHILLGMSPNDLFASTGMFWFCIPQVCPDLAAAAAVSWYGCQCHALTQLCLGQATHQPVKNHPHIRSPCPTLCFTSALAGPVVGRFLGFLKDNHWVRQELSAK